MLIEPSILIMLCIHFLYVWLGESASKGSGVHGSTIFLKQLVIIIISQFQMTAPPPPLPPGYKMKTHHSPEELL